VELTEPKSHISFDDGKQPGFLTPKNYIKQRKGNTTGRIFKAMQERKELSTEVRSKALSREFDRDKLRSGLTNQRIKIFRSKEKAGASPPREEPLKGFDLRSLRVHDLPAETRRWFEANKREILYQGEKICSYELIRRYMSDGEIAVRLRQMV
jgi:hypothetical protein